MKEKWNFRDKANCLAGGMRLNLEEIYCLCPVLLHNRLMRDGSRRQTPLAHISDCGALNKRSMKIQFQVI